MELKITQAEGPDGWLVIITEGEIDLATAPRVDAAFDDAIENGAERIAIDLRTVSFMDSTGLRSVITAHRRLEMASGRFAVVADDGPARRLLEVAGVMAVLSVVATPEDLTS